MNAKAEKFQKFLAEKEIKCFQVHEMESEFNTVIFRSNIDMNGSSLPTTIILDDTIYGMIHILVAADAVKAKGELAVLRLLNELNRGYKPFKYSIDNENNLLLEVCLARDTEEISGEFVYLMLEVLIEHLKVTFPEITKYIAGEEASAEEVVAKSAEGVKQVKEENDKAKKAKRSK